MHKRDQYTRVVSTIYVRRWLLRRDVGLEMIKSGLATIYEAKTGAEFGGKESIYREAERIAKKKRRGIWKDKNFESPREYKSKYTSEPKESQNTGVQKKSWWRFWL
jgi:endonuclease YncB( thermonuclease family)